MTEITIVVSPAFDRRGKRGHDRFDARIQGLDQVICEATRQPLLDASRRRAPRSANKNRWARVEILVPDRPPAKAFF